MKYLEFMALCRTNVASNGFSLAGQRRQHDRHSTKVCLDERLVFLHRRTDPVALGWKAISISDFVLFLGRKGILLSAEGCSIIRFE